MKLQIWYTLCIVKFMSGWTWVSGIFFLPAFELLLWAEQLFRTLSHSVFRPPGHSRYLSTSSVTFFSLTSLNLFLFLLQQYTVPDIHSFPFGYSYLFSSAFPSSSVTSTLFCYSSQHLWALSSSTILIFLLIKRKCHSLLLVASSCYCYLQYHF